MGNQLEMNGTKFASESLGKYAHIAKKNLRILWTWNSETCKCNVESRAAKDSTNG